MDKNQSEAVSENPKIVCARKNFDYNGQLRDYTVSISFDFNSVKSSIFLMYLSVSFWISS